MVKLKFGIFFSDKFDNVFKQITDDRDLSPICHRIYYLNDERCAQ
jgi:hypothetical protein